jgi:hypothetical protein
MAVSQFYPLRAFAHSSFPCDSDLDLDPRVLRGGNLCRTFDVGHWLRDGRLSFGPGSVTIAPGTHGGISRHHSVIPDTGVYDLIIVGGGISGLATAFFARQIAPAANILILENNPRAGGNASRDDGAPLPAPASAAGAYFAYPYDDFLFDFYGGIGIDWDNYIIPSPIYSYYFDADVGPSTTRAAMFPGTKRWVNDAYSAKGISEFPFAPSLVRQFKQARQMFRNWYVRNGAPTDPPDDSDPQYDYLAFMSLRDYLQNEEDFDPVIADFYDQYASDSLAAPASEANAHSAISFLGAEYNDLVSAPGGLSFVARKALKTLIPGAIDGDSDQEILNNPINESALDLPGNPVRCRTGVTAVRCDTDYNGASVHYWDPMSASFLQAEASAVVLAGQMYTARHLVDHLLDGNQRAAMQAYRSMPTPIANVVVNNSHFLVDAEIGYNFYWYGDSPRIWQDAVVGDWTAVGGTSAAEDGGRPNVLTVYSGGFGPYSEGSQARISLLNEPFSTYEDALREDLSRIFAGTSFDYDQDVSAVHLYRWGHSFVAPAVGWLFGTPASVPPGQAKRVEGDRHRGRAPLGRISFAAQDSEGNPAIECAIFSGRRAAQEVASFL